MTRRGEDDLRRLSSDQRERTGVTAEEQAAIELGWAEILQRRTWRRLGLSLSELPMDAYNDLFYQFLRDQYQMLCQPRQSWRRFDERLDDMLGPDKVEQLKSRLHG